MATIRAYTTIEQSRKLAEILPFESADMYYFLDPTPAGNIYHLVVQQIAFGVRTREPEYDKGDIPCWSLASLLGVLPSHFYDETGRKTLGMEKGDIYYNIFYENNNSYIQKRADNPVDACVAMIENLNELKML